MPSTTSPRRSRRFIWRSAGTWMVVFAVGLAAVAITLALLQATSLTDRLMVQAEGHSGGLGSTLGHDCQRSVDMMVMVSRCSALVATLLVVAMGATTWADQRSDAAIGRSAKRSVDGPAALGVDTGDISLNVVAGSECVDPSDVVVVSLNISNLSAAINGYAATSRDSASGYFPNPVSAAPSMLLVLAVFQ